MVFVIWFVGFNCAFCFGITYFVSLIYTPFGIQVFKFLKLIAMPFNINVAIKFNRPAGAVIGNILWLIFGLNLPFVFICSIFMLLFKATVISYSM